MHLRSLVIGALAGSLAASLVTGPAVARPSEKSYRFFKQGSDRSTPGAYWNPCRVIRYGIDFGYARRAGLRPAWEERRWRSVVDEYEKAMGINFVYTGRVSTRASSGRPVGGPEMVITFGNAARQGRYGYGRVLKGAIAGVAGVQWSGVAGTSRMEVQRGYVVIDADDVVAKVDRRPPDLRPASKRPQDIVRALYLHEFGHAVGLDHVTDRTQLMYPQLVQGRPDEFGTGDYAGLRILGRQRCF